jgi:polar amino acid transport system substrate-binding protein
MSLNMRQLLLLCSLFCVWQHVFAEPLLLVTANYPPFSYEESGRQKGIAIDLVKEAFSRMHQEIRINLIPFPRAVLMVKSGEADGIFPFAMRDERKLFVRYPVERLITDPGMLFVRADSTIVFDGDYAKLAVYTIGMQRGTDHGPVFMQALKTYSIKVDEAIDQEQNVMKLIAGRFDIAVGPGLVVQHAAKRNGKLSEIKILSSRISEGDAYLGFSLAKNHDVVIQALEKTIRQMRRDGSYDKIVRTYSLE